MLTNLAQIWNLSPSERDREWPIRTEFTLYYYDPEWLCSWGALADGAPAYLPIGRDGPPLKPGQKILLEGVIHPQQQQVIWERSRVRVLAENQFPKPLFFKDNLNDLSRMDGCWVELEGFVDTQQETSGRVDISLLAHGIPLKVYSMDTEEARERDLVNRLLRLRGILSITRNPSGNDYTYNFWVPDLKSVEVIGELETDSRFELPVTRSSDFATTPSNTLVRVEGVVRSAHPGREVIIWDSTGEIEIRTLQNSRFSIGQPVEAVGYPRQHAIFKTLRGAMVRPRSGKTPLERSERFHLAGQVRELTAEEAARGAPVQLESLVLWMSRGKDFLYVQDTSGGIRVHFTNSLPRNAEPGALVRVRGHAAEGQFSPVVTNAVVEWVEMVGLPEARFITLEQALTGVEEGNWVEIRGCILEAERRGNTCEMKLSASSGDFEAALPWEEWMGTLPGAVAQVRGVCTAVPTSRGFLKGIRLWTPHSSLLQLDQTENVDGFELPLQRIAKLRRFNAYQASFKRVRTSGTVTLHVPGRFLYIQDGEDPLFVLSRDKTRLQVGQEVEVTGFPDNQKGEFQLRDASYRPLRSGKEMVPAQLSNPGIINEDLDHKLVLAEGRLVEAVHTEEGWMMQVQSAERLFQVLLYYGELDRNFAKIDSMLNLVGIYDVVRDEYGRAQTFRILLRSADDVRVLQAAPWWTAARLAWILLGSTCVIMVGAMWGMTIWRKNLLLRRAQAALEEANRTLEIRVEERTRELHEQVEAKELARRELAAAQERLLRASHQAGMAEIATSVLHNVGNVLNSVNISASVLRDQVRASKVAQLSKVATLLRENETRLPEFLLHDNKGRQVIEYLSKLSEHLSTEQQSLGEEASLLSRNVEHIKEIIAMQQTYARAGGMVEILKPADVLEDAIRMQAAAFHRHGVELCREFEAVPEVSLDRHRVLQILNNLLQNAKTACVKGRNQGRQVIIGLSLDASLGQLRVTVQDNGEGIQPENLARIFSFGFTTRETGHGFGLHSSALAAREMGGSLQVHSEGPGRGATFTLSLPAGEKKML